MRGSMAPLLFRYGAWYLWGGVWAYAGISAFAGSSALASGGRIYGAVLASAGMIMVAFTVRAHVGLRGSEKTQLRAELLTLVRERDGTADGWLNRDAHVLFTADHAGPRWMRRWLLCRADEDMVRELEEEGRIAATAEVFTMMPVTPEVLHYVGGAIVTDYGDGDVDIQMSDPQMGFLRRVRQHWRMERTGMLYAGPAEIRELTAQFRDAEPMTVPGTGGGT